MSEQSITELLNQLQSSIEADDLDQAEATLDSIIERYDNLEAVETSQKQRAKSGNESSEISDTGDESLAQYRLQHLRTEYARGSFLSMASLYLTDPAAVDQSELTDAISELIPEEESLNAAAANASETLSGVSIAPQVAVASVTRQQKVILLEESLSVSVQLVNAGDETAEGIAVSGTGSLVSVSPGEQSVGSLSGGETTVVEFEATGSDAGSGSIQLAVSSDNAGTATRSVPITVAEPVGIFETSLTTLRDIRTQLESLDTLSSDQRQSVIETVDVAISDLESAESASTEGEQVSSVQSARESVQTFRDSIASEGALSQSISRSLTNKANVVIQKLGSVLDTSDSEPTDTSTTRTLTIAGNGPFGYDVVVDGSIEPDRYGGDFAADEDDEPEEISEGVFSFTNETGPEPENASPTAFRGDRFLFSGAVETFEVTPQRSETEVNVYLDEENSSVESIRGFSDTSGDTHSVMITANGPTEYTITVDGELEPDRFGGIYVGDTLDLPITTPEGDLLVTDESGPAESDAGPTNYRGDRFLFTGDVLRVDATTELSDSDVLFYVDEQLTDPSDVITDPTVGSGYSADSYEGTDVVGENSTLEVRSTADNQFGYTVVIAGSASKSETDELTADDEDIVEPFTSDTSIIKGRTGDEAGDAFTVDGEILAVTITGVDSGFEILLDEEEVTGRVLS